LFDPKAGLAHLRIGGILEPMGLLEVRVEPFGVSDRELHKVKSRNHESIRGSLVADSIKDVALEL
jgi:hypothetical protein